MADEDPDLGPEAYRAYREGLRGPPPKKRGVLGTLRMLFVGIVVTLLALFVVSIGGAFFTQMLGSAR